MAQRVINQLIDDLDDTVIADGKGGPIEFALRGTTYRVDLTKANAAKLDEALAPFIAAATKSSGSRSTTKRAGTGARRGRPAGKRTGAAPIAAVRAWAAENGYEVSTRGRIPAAIVEAYELARKHAK